ncbi:annexin A4-like protein, partial [Dinothrombium tinctorium]
VLIEILTNHNSKQRKQIAFAYRIKFDRELIDDLRLNLAGNFEDACVALLTPYHEFCADAIYKSLTVS